MMRGVRTCRNCCPIGQIVTASESPAVQWNRSIVEVRHAHT